MATNENPSFDDFDPVESTSEDSGSDWINLDAGEETVGPITALNLDAGDPTDAGVVEIDGRPMDLNWTIRRDLIESLVVGRLMAVRKLEEEESFTNDDGEEIVYNPKEARFE